MPSNSYHSVMLQFCEESEIRVSLSRICKHLDSTVYIYQGMRNDQTPDLLPLPFTHILSEIHTCKQQNKRVSTLTQELKSDLIQGIYDFISFKR